MVRVTILNHDEHIHRASGVHFRPTKVKNVWLGTADVEDAVAAEHFAPVPELFRVEALPSDAVLAPTVEPTSPAPSPEPTPDANGAAQGGASEGAVPASETVITAPETKTVPDFAGMEYSALKELAKLADLGLPGNASKAALIAALLAHATK